MTDALDDLAGRTLLHYRLLHRLGAGGMGEVYKAHDERLDRSVAVKILPAALSGNPDRIARFEREARIASSLSHPAIAAVYEVGHAEGLHFIAMEYVEGHGLTTWLDQERPRLAEVLKVMEQVGDALARAHQAGVLHRDLKPANVVVSRGGRAKLLDFGLAKIAGDSGAHPDAETQEQLTATGIVLGTLAYMSPEQAKGHPSDRRSDVFSFGILLYEVVAGTHPFPAAAGLEAAAGVLRDDPIPVLRRRPEVPVDLVRAVGKALEKDPARRYQFMDDLVVDLRAVRNSIESGEWHAFAGRVRRARGWLWLAGGVAVGVALAAATLALPGFRARGAPPEPLPVARPGARVRPLTFGGLNLDPSLSPRGDRVCYASMRDGSFDILIQDLPTGHVVRVTEDPGDELEPSISPDGNLVAFVTQDGKLQTVPALGGPVRTLVASGAAAPVWSPDGQRLAYQSRRSLFVVGRTGGSPVPVQSTGDLPVIMRAAWSPDGASLVFPSIVEGKYVLARVSPDGSGRSVLGRDLEALGSPVWSGDGKWIVGSMGPPRTHATEIWGVSLAGAAVRAPVRLVGGVLLHRKPALSRDGRRLAVEVTQARRLLMRAPVTAAGVETAVAVPAQVSVLSPSVAPDGTAVAVITEQGGRQVIGKLSPGDQRLEVLREGGGDDEQPAWSPDGGHIAFSHIDAGSRRIALIDASGGDLTFLSDPQLSAWDPAWSPDGQRVAFVARGVGSSVRIVPRTGGPDRELWAGGLSLRRLTWSADGRWLAVGAQTREGDRSVALIPVAGGDLEVIVSGALAPTWLPDGRIGFLRQTRSGTLDLWTARVSADGRLVAGSERPLTRLPRTQSVDDFGASSDGRFLYFSVEERIATDIWLLEAPD